MNCNDKIPEFKRKINSGEIGLDEIPNGLSPCERKIVRKLQAYKKAEQLNSGPSQETVYGESATPYWMTNEAQKEKQQNIKRYGVAPKNNAFQSRFASTYGKYKGIKARKGKGKGGSRKSRKSRKSNRK